HLPTAAVGLGVIVLLVVLKIVRRKVPGALIAMLVASLAVVVFRLDERGVAVIGELPRSLPPVADLPLFNLNFIAQLSTGALAVGAIGLVETMAIARSLATQTGQRLDSNQEFVGQGLFNVAAGFLSGYPGAGSFSRSAVNFNAGARTPLASVFSGLFVLVAMFVLGPLAAYLPRAALAGVLIIVAFNMIHREEIARIWRGARGDAIIMLVTFLGTLFLAIEFAVLLGILLSFALYIMRTSTPRVQAVMPDDDFRHFLHQPDKPCCPQLGVIDVLGDLYFGAVNHVEEAIHQHLTRYPDQRFLLIRMHNVNHCDFSGIHMLESVVRLYRDRGGDVFLVRVSPPVKKLMHSTSFDTFLGQDHFLSEDRAIDYLFHRVLDPSICIYECPVRAFKECQNLPKHFYPQAVAILRPARVKENHAEDIPPQELRRLLLAGERPVTVIDVREPREFKRGHIPQAQLKPLPSLLSENMEFAEDCLVVFVCRTGRRSRLAAHLLHEKGCCKHVAILQGGMLAWETAGLLAAVE
ncbi:MAG: STAS domain-containing protein, partial [Chloroflexi bacterium]|nr:STAS domain-containing protein [Chloroflexota bacterium]